MKLSKALRVKNQIVLRINKIQSIIQKHNSYNVENIPKWDVNEQLTKLTELKNKLCELKTKISIANKDILSTIHLMAETKATLSFMDEVSSTSGVKTLSYPDRKEEFACFIGEIEKAKLIEELQESLDTYQDGLAEHNAKTKIDFSL